MRKLQWRITGYDRGTPIFEMKVAFGQLSERKIMQLLKTLVAKAGLTDSEIVGAYAKRGTKLANHLLDVQKDSSQATYICGSNRYFVANVMDNSGTIVRYPRLS